MTLYVFQDGKKVVGRNRQTPPMEDRVEPLLEGRPIRHAPQEENEARRIFSSVPLRLRHQQL